MKAYTQESYIAAASAAHKQRYVYDSTVYVGSKEKIEVGCLLHGKFSVKANAHLNSLVGCPICGRLKCDENRKLSTEEFVNRARKLHQERYSYEKTVYSSMKDLVLVTCPEHGTFSVRAHDHVKANALTGCRRCRRGCHSRMAIDWLDAIASAEHLYIQHAENGGEFRIPATPYRVDGYAPSTNTVYEFYGDKWHGNPVVFASHTRCHPFETMTAGQLYDKTMEREAVIKSLGYQIVSKWETSPK